MNSEVNAGGAQAHGRAHPARLTVGVIGAGRVGSALGAALARAGHQVVAVSGVSEASRERARRYLPAVPLTQPDVAVARSELVLLAVPDDALPGLVAGLAATGADLAGRLLVHTSGRYGTQVLQPAVQRGALPLALHPVMTFTGRPDDIDRLDGICFGVTAPDRLRLAAEALVIEMGGEPVFIREADRGLYHAALASAANHLVALVAEASDLLRSAGVPDPGRMLGPLLSAALDNALRLGDAGLTGPVVRADADTVARHVEVLGAASRRALGAYLALARLTASRALDAGLLAPADARRLLDVLTDPGTQRPGQAAGATPLLARTRAELAAARAGLGAPVVLVPTMGALHDGHVALLRRARELAGPGGSVVVSVFVNPLQFGPAEDFDRYPRTLDADLAVCAAAGVALVFAPGRHDMYPRDPLVTVDPGPAGQVLEGEFRPGFFGGVLTVVLKLFQLVRPDIAVFGEKDAQQLALVRRMAADLDLGVRIESVPVVRDGDGLATSSRNGYLSGPERAAALAIPAALAAGRAAAGGGPASVLAAARRELGHGEPGKPALTVDYLSLVHPETFLPVDQEHAGPAVLAVAAWAGSTRLIDNAPLAVGGDAGSGD